MKTAKLLYAEKETRPDGTEAKVCTLLTSAPYAGGFFDPAFVLGLSANDIIAPGSVLITPTQNYIAWDDNVFGAVGEEYGDAPSWCAYTVTYTYGDEEETGYHEALVSISGDHTHTVIGAPDKLADGSPVPEGVIFTGWTIDGETKYQPGDEIIVEADTWLEPTWEEMTHSTDWPVIPTDPHFPGGGLGHN